MVTRSNMLGRTSMANTNATNRLPKELLATTVYLFTQTLKSHENEIFEANELLSVMSKKLAGYERAMGRNEKVIKLIHAKTA